jgi:dihydroorotase
VPPSYDLLLRGGMVIDPSQSIAEIRDVAISNGKVAHLAKALDPAAARLVEDVTGLLVLPGLIDFHGHYFYGAHPSWVLPDEHCPRTGVTTSVDAGSTGHLNFPGLRHWVISNSRTRIYAQLNVAGLGILPMVFNGELLNLGVVDIDRSIECVNRNRDTIVGIKVRIAFQATGMENGPAALDLALKLAEATGLRLTVHVANTPLPLPYILERLRPGDVVAHIYNPRHHNILNWERNVVPTVWEAKERGVLFDAARGGGMDFNIARVAMEQGVLPDIISSDLHVYPPGSPLCTLPEVLSMFLELGLPLEKVVAATTCKVAQVLDRQREHGSLRPGACADIAVFSLDEGTYPYRDTSDNVLNVSKLLKARLTLRAGAVVWREE